MATVRIREDRHGRPAYWELNWTDKDGKRHRHNLGPVDLITKRQAEDICKAKDLELSPVTELLGGHSRPALTFGQYAQDYLVWHQSEYPDSNYRVAQIIHDHLLPRFQYTAMDLFTSEQAEEYKRQRKREKAKAHTITKELRTWKAVINKAIEDKLIRESGIASVKAPRILDAKPHHFYEADDLRALYAACAMEVNNGEGPQPNPLHAAVWRLYANTGMRRGEGMQLKRKEIGREEIRIISTGEERTKSGDWRIIPKSEGAAEALDRLKHEVDGPYVLPRMTMPSLSRGFARDARRAKLPGSLHTLRHTYISHLVRDTATPIRTVQLYAGHASITTTEGYLYLRDKHGGAPAAAMRL